MFKQFILASIVVVSTACVVAIATGAPICTRKTEINILTKDRDDPRALKIRDALRKEGCIANAYPRSEPGERVRQGEIRYFHKKDRTAAINIAAYVRQDVQMNLDVKQVQYAAPEETFDIYLTDN